MKEGGGLYDTPDELLREIEAGEDSLIEFKEVVWKQTDKGYEFRFVKGEGKAQEELAKDLSCFANSEGGVIVFGVRKDGERVGLPDEVLTALMRFIEDTAENKVEPPMGHLLAILDRVLLPDRSGNLKLCLKLEIKKAFYSVHAPRGTKRPFHRIGSQCQPVSLDHLARLMERRGMSLPFEERPVHTVTTDALDRERFAAYHLTKYGYPLGEATLSYERLLQNLKLAAADEGGTLRPTVAGLLLFCDRPDAHLPGAYVDLVAYGGSHPDAAAQLDAKAIHGPLVEQIERTIDYLRHSPLVPVRATKDGLGRIDQPSYSLRALQEAVVNALVHRDYSIRGSQVRVFLFKDRIEISNPGRLHNTITVEGLFAGCPPVRRNQILAGILREYENPLTRRSYMEGRGEGFLMMVRECQQVSGRPPKMEIIGDSVRLTIYARPEATAGNGESP